MIPSIKTKVIECPSSISENLRFELWFQRDDPRTFGTVPALEPFSDSTHGISLRQAPCLTTLRKSPLTFTKSRSGLLQELGFNLLPVTPSPSDTITAFLVGESNDSSSELEVGHETLLKAVIANEGLEDFEPDPGPEPFIPVGLKNKLRMDYSDPWMLFAGRELASVRNQKVRPVLNVWYADLHRISDPIPIECLGPEFTKGLKVTKRCRPVRLTEIKNFDCVKFLIFNHTHWGSTLAGMARRSTDRKVRRWASTLEERIISFLEGKPDPLWSSEQLESYYKHPKERRQYSKRAGRFLELLQTVAGVFVQRYLCFPEEVWTWRKFDLFNLKNLSYLITDEFFDGECNPIVLTIPTFYKSLKATRKLFKWAAFNDEHVNSIRDKIPGWLRTCIPVMDAILERTPSEHKVFQIGIMSQSRGCGSPPMIDMLLSKQKFAQTVTTPVTPLTKFSRLLIRSGMNDIMSRIPDHAFTGLENKAMITLTTSASIEMTVAEGGTVQAISEEINRYPNYALVPIRDLVTGEIVKRVHRDSLSIGDKIFWHCLQRVIETDPVELRKVKLLVVREPGKARCVTKGCSYLKVVLDVVSKICSWPLKRGIESSRSGMSLESHGWEFFKSMFNRTEEGPNLFDIKSKKVRVLSPNVNLVTEEYKDVFVSSTDYETATDYMNYEVASYVSRQWMTRCGVPPVLQGIVVETCYKPRWVYLDATGPLANLGEPTETLGVRKVLTSRGVLMGDPLTKPCLHIINVLARTIAEKMPSADFYARECKDPSRIPDILRGMN